ncbi:MAG: heavy-metal-associated domain-containing protein [Clostridia bacterium]|nr:heavy-metal-associated domain-containing protein [Clostridia bacterium]
MFGFGKKKKIEIYIEGMSCKHCSERVERLLNAVPGVKAAVDLEGAKAVIEAPAKVSIEKLKKVIEESGFKAVEK